MKLFRAHPVRGPESASKDVAIVGKGLFWAWNSHIETLP